MSLEFDRESPGKFASRTLSRKTLNRWTGRGPNLPPKNVPAKIRRLKLSGELPMGMRVPSL